MTDIERKKAAAKARVKRQREKIYADPALLEEYRRKERERYKSVSESNQIKAPQGYSVNIFFIVLKCCLLVTIESVVVGSLETRKVEMKSPCNYLSVIISVIIGKVYICNDL